MINVPSVPVTGQWYATFLKPKIQDVSEVVSKQIALMPSRWNVPTWLKKSSRQVQALARLSKQKRPGQPVNARVSVYFAVNWCLLQLSRHQAAARVIHGLIELGTFCPAKAVIVGATGFAKSRMPPATVPRTIIRVAPEKKEAPSEVRDRSPPCPGSPGRTK